MIFDVNGKRLAFALEWRLLVAAGSPTSLATEQAQGAKARLLWHNGKANYTGLLLPSTRMPPGNGTIYAAAAAFMRLPGLPSEALFVQRTQDSNYVVVGIKDGRPRKGFDQAGIGYEEAKELYEKFGAICGETGFAPVGDAAIPFMRDATTLTLDDLATLADHSCALRPPSKAAQYRTLALTAVALGVCAVFGPKVYHTYVSPPQVQEQRTPNQLYHDYLAEHASDPIQLAQNYDAWYRWVRSLSPRYGGWAMKSVDCDFQNPQSEGGGYVPWNGHPTCTLAFTRDVKVLATNETFVKSIPSDWSKAAAVYNASNDQMSVVLHPTLGAHGRLSAVLAVAGTPDDRDVAFVSKLQRAGALLHDTSLLAPSPFVLPPGVPRANIQGPVFMATRWRVSGQFHYAEVLAGFPPYATLTKATLSIDKNAAAGETPYNITLAGAVITRY